ncbi:RsiV family protein [Brevibacillus humidisoli]|uniref:RsiV family protein n=1 Tax=Brevibacillus humidisoli TaxID=2895522 RepID=UPI0030BA02BD
MESSLNEKYLAEGKRLYEEFMTDMADLQKNGIEAHLGVESGYVVKTDTEQILSVGRYVVNTVGSSSTTFQYDTIDKKNQVLITLPSLFKDDRYIAVISENIKEQMRDQMEADPEKIYWVSVLGQEEPFTVFEAIAKDQSFYINSDNKLVISFDKYEVAPGYMGVVEFVIPTEVLSDLLVSDTYVK